MANASNGKGRDRGVNTREIRGRPFQKGNPGKPKGAVGRVSRDMKEMFELALHTLGDEKWLVAAARKDPSTFMRCLAKLLPRSLEMAGGLNLVFPDLPADQGTAKAAKDLLVKRLGK